MENLASFIKSCRSLQLSKHLGNPNLTNEVLFEIGHVRSNLPGGLDRVLNTMNILRNTFDPSEATIIAANLAHQAAARRSVQLEEKDEVETSFDTVYTKNNSNGRGSNSGTTGNDNVNGEEDFSIESPLAATPTGLNNSDHSLNSRQFERVSNGGGGGDGDITTAISADKSSSNLSSTKPLSTTITFTTPSPSSSSSTTTTPTANGQSNPSSTSTSSTSSSSTTTILSPVASSPSQAEMERRRLMDQFKIKAMSSSRTLQTPSPPLQAAGLNNNNSSETPGTDQGTTTPAFHRTSSSSSTSSLYASSSSNTSSNALNEPQKKGSVKIIFRKAAETTN